MTPAQDVMAVAVKNKDINLRALLSLFLTATPIAYA
jgi:hypothetical protein